ncbi:hypothetical protein LOZ66_002561 [Ophidiomyces ophidiicola]|nr:hypothetical protein LOZ66_002561 [Ophidiomyces ophidiicola]
MLNVLRNRLNGSRDSRLRSMSADFWAGYLSGAIGIIIGNPLDIIKVRLQATPTNPTNGATVPNPRQFEGAGSLIRGMASIISQFSQTRAHFLVAGAAAPIIGYGALNALLFVAYNRTLMYLCPSVTDPTNPTTASLSRIWLAGAVGGLASWTISSPTELIKCRAQLGFQSSVSSWTVANDIMRTRGLKGLYFGGIITSIRDSVGYGF